MAAPILWAPGIFLGFFLLKNPHAHKIPPFRGGGGVLGFFLNAGGGSANFFVLNGRGDFSESQEELSVTRYSAMGGVALRTIENQQLNHTYNVATKLLSRWLSGPHVRPP